MENEKIIKKIKQQLRESLKDGNKILKANKDWQQSKVYTFEHSSMHKLPITTKRIQQISNRIGNLWGVKIQCLFPSYSHEEEYICAWPLNEFEGVIQISPDYQYLYCAVHECSHVITECLKMRSPFKRIKEPGHGTLWTGIYCWNLGKMMGRNPTLFKQKFEDNNIKVMSLEPIEDLRKLMRNKVI